MQGVLAKETSRKLNNKPTRDIGLDLTRIVAFVSVPSVHFFLNSGFYSNPEAGLPMLGMTILRTFFAICVPLFMLISGYLLSGKTVIINRKGLLSYYSKLSKTVLTYVLTVLLIIAFEYINHTIGAREVFFNLFGFKYYSWYVEMYIGLFLLTPFLNILWQGLEDRNSRKALLIVLILLTVLPSMLNIWSISEAGFAAFKQPWLYAEYSKIVPAWWTGIYPVTYYFAGAYIRRDVNIKRLNTLYLLLLLIICVVMFGLFNYYRSYSVHFIWGEWNSWQGFENLIDSILVFLTINSIDYRKPTPAITKIVSYIANLTLGAYLLSWIPDHYYYPKFKETVPDMLDRFRYFPVMVSKTIIISLLLSAAVYMVIKWSGMISSNKRIAKQRTPE